MTYTLRDLPLPVKVVATVFLLAVGVGYTSAMLQLHIQDSKSGKPMPTPDDVVLKFTGKKRSDPNAPPPRPVSRLEALVVAPSEVISGNSMAAAFTTEDRAKPALNYNKTIRGQLPEVVEQVKAERKGEQAVFALWINAPDAERKAAYEADKFTPPAGQMPKAFTPALADGNAVKIQTLIEARCVTCHSKGGEKEDIPLDNYDCVARFMEVPDAAPAGKWVKVEEPISISKLTQSTHAHLLSFAMLFSLTGLIFAFSSWPAWMRVIVGPWVVIAIFVDVSCWWLARLCDQSGPYFAQAVIGTGFLAGVGLFVQIAGSLFTMYGLKGRAVIGLLFVVGALAGGAFVTKLLAPALPKPKAVEKPEEKKNGPAPGKSLADDVSAAGGAIGNAVAKTKAVAVTLRKPAHALDKLLIWPPVDLDGNPVPLPDDPKTFPFNGEGTMVHAFFEKDKAFNNLPADEKDKVRANRQGDLDAMLAWVRASDPARKSAYAADAFDLPGLNGNAITPEFVKDGKVRIKTLIDMRCATCHGEGGKQYDDYPLDTYAGLAKYLKAFDAPAPKVDGNAGAPQPAPAPAADPIPAAKDD